MNAHFLNKRLARLLGIAALLPFFLLSIACFITPTDLLAILVRGQLGYGIAILSFLGGLHWGAALASPQLTMEQTKKSLIWGVVPASIAFGSLMLEIGFGFLVLAFGIIGAYKVDQRLYAWYNMPDWFIHLRLTLTKIVVLSLILTFVAVNLNSEKPAQAPEPASALKPSATSFATSSATSANQPKN